VFVCRVMGDELILFKCKNIVLYLVWCGQARITDILKTSDKNLDDIFRFLYM
jgi:hypothetical protein